MTPESEKWRERVGLFKRKAEAEGQAWWELWSTMTELIAQLPDSDNKSQMQRALDNRLNAFNTANQDFMAGWETHKAKWLAGSE
jgi:hypothetical protein